MTQFGRPARLIETQGLGRYLSKEPIPSHFLGELMSAEHPTPLLDRVRTPEDVRALDDHDLPQLAAELRQETIDAVSVTGGHLGAGLGVVELTIALQKVFETPKDKLIWDVGHQTYPHKI